MRKTLTLALVLLFAAAAPLVWAQDDPGDDALQAADESQAGTEEPGDEQVESDQGGEPEEDAAAADEPSESEAPEDASPDQEAFDADEAAESGDASESDSAAVDESADAMAQADEEEEAEDSTDDEDSLASDDAAAESADAEAQMSGGANGEGAAADSASTVSSEPAPASDPRPAPAPTQSQPAPNPTPTAVAAANTGGNQGSGGTEWPRANYRFMVDIGMGEGEVPFQEVSGLDVETQIIEYRAGNSPTFSTIKMPGIQKSGNVTLKKGIFAKDNKFFEWQRNIKLNTTQRTTVTIKLLDESGAPVMTWTLANAWPTKITGTDMKSDGNEVAVESIEIAHEGATVSQ